MSTVAFAAAIGVSAFRFVQLDPGHFHAALVQKRAYPAAEVSPDVRVYAPKGPELDSHLALVRAFGERADNPAKWNEIVYAGPGWLEAFETETPIRRRLGGEEIAILAGRNDRKIDYALSAVRCGCHVLADKPLVIGADGYAKLEGVVAAAKTGRRAFADLMTLRYSVRQRLVAALSQDAELTGGLKKGTEDDPAVVRSSVHHFLKTVNGSPLRRPAWYYDVSRQGLAIVDVTTHLVDAVQWSLFPGATLSKDDVEMLSARVWPTVVSAADYEASTGVAASAPVSVDANGSFTYRLRGVAIGISVEWRVSAPPGGGDSEYAAFKGEKATVGLRQTPKDGFEPVIFVHPAAGEDAAALRARLEKSVERLSKRWPGLSVAADRADGWKVVVPDGLEISHEEQFNCVARYFLAWARDGEPDCEYANLLVKYHTLVSARAKAGM